MNIIETKQKKLTHHQVYQSFNSIEAIQHFMRYHVFAVWDFMSLLKSLQNHITCTQVPWKPSVYPAEMVRLVNQIVVGEESDLDQYGHAISHFDLYIKAMEEVGASTVEIKRFLKTLDLNDIPHGAREFVSHNLQIAKFGHVVEVASSFFYGREKLIPDMFQTIIDTLKKENVEAPTLIYYLQRHIEVDGNEHGPLALKCLDYLTGGDSKLESLALHSGKDALQKRQELWDFVLSRLPN